MQHEVCPCGKIGRRVCKCISKEHEKANDINNVSQSHDEVHDNWQRKVAPISLKYFKDSPYLLQKADTHAVLTDRMAPSV